MSLPTSSKPLPCLPHTGPSLTSIFFISFALFSYVKALPLVLPLIALYSPSTESSESHTADIQLRLAAYWGYSTTVTTLALFLGLCSARDGSEQYVTLWRLTACMFAVTDVLVAVTYMPAKRLGEPGFSLFAFLIAVLIAALVDAMYVGVVTHAGARCVDGAGAAQRSEGQHPSGAFEENEMTKMVQPGAPQCRASSESVVDTGESNLAGGRHARSASTSGEEVTLMGNVDHVV